MVAAALVDDRQRGSVVAEVGLVLDDAVELFQILSLVSRFSVGGLDPGVAIGEVVQIGGVDPAEDRVGVSLFDLCPSRPTCRAACRSCRGPCPERFLVDIGNDDVVSNLGADLGDAVAHQTAANNPNLLISSFLPPVAKIRECPRDGGRRPATGPIRSKSSIPGGDAEAQIARQVRPVPGVLLLHLSGLIAQVIPGL